MKNHISPRRARVAVACALLATALVGLVPGISHASTAGPGGANVGFDFSWDDGANPAGHSAAFLEADGVTANNCAGGALTATTKTCNFVFDYRIGGVSQPSAAHAARYISYWTTPSSYANGAPAANSGCSSPTSAGGNLGKAPLTLFDCFNANSFGQVFRAGSAGQLTEFRMSMTCLAPAGTQYELYALLYEMNADGTAIVGSGPLGATLVNLSKCPTSANWKAKAFKSSDFGMVSMNLGSPTVTAGKFYGVFMTGTGVPGTPPVGAVAAMQRAKAATTTTTTTSTTTTTTTTPWSSFKNQSNTKKPVATTVAPSKTSTATTVANVPAVLLPDNVGAASIIMSAVRVMSAGAEKSYVVNSLTTKTCVGAGRNLVFLKEGRCTAQLTYRSNGKIASTVSTNVTTGDIPVSDVVVAVAEPTVIRFINGTALSTASARKQIANISSAARKASAVLVTGHTGNAGGETDKMTSLSQKRAMAARSLLRDRGVTGVIAIQSYGATQTVSNSKKEAQQALNRRAEIYIIP